MWKNLAPNIFRQRLVIEGYTEKRITADHIKRYLAGLSKTIHMKILMKPVTSHSKRFGWAGWVHWEESGCHFYAWDKPSPFFSADIYTCKKFSKLRAVAFTKKFFRSKRIVWKEVKI
jgi:S-adenosylmethionine decarboxylase